MRKLFSVMLAIGVLASVAIPANAAPPAPTDVTGLAISEPVPVDATGRMKVDPALRTATGNVNVVVRLKDAPLAVVNGDGFRQASRAGAQRASATQQQAYLAQLSQAQSTFVAQASALGAKEIARFAKALNGVAMTVDVSQIGKLAELPGVVSVRGIRNYELDLSETVAYIGADPSVLPAGINGEGLRVAVLDSGIDYTHAKLGGAGTEAAYVAAYGTSPSDPRNTTRDGLFPTAKVVDGYDFVGESWPNTPEIPDPDPIDYEGHGTHVADIIAGNGVVRLRAVHASPDAPNVDVLVNDAVAFGNVPFKAISDYATLAPGKYNIKITAAGNPGAVVFNADLDIAAGDYTAIAVGLLADDGKVDVKVLADSNKAPADKAKVRFFHGSPDAPAVDIAVKGGPVLFANVSFGNAADYIEVPGGTYDLEVRLAGTNTVVLPLPGIKVANGKTYTAYAVGLAGATPSTLGAIISVDAAPVTGPGVAPGASLVAIKVCSAVSSSCSGVALLQGVEFALDPNGDGNMDDAVDVMNLSLGSNYGQKEDDLSFALGNASRAGIVVVASAGNAADRPYIVGSPSSQPEVISVAQTSVPSAKTFPLVINSPASIAGPINNTNTVDWAPVGDGFTGDVAYVGRACPGDALLANPTGKVALIDRGACAVSLKVDLAAKAGAVAVLVANNAGGDPPSFSFGGGDTFVPTLVLTQGDGARIKTAINGGATVNVSVSPAVSVALKGSIVASSSRGPSFSFSAIKPEIGAPGASVSAIAGSGTAVEAFGGTSGAAPMVSGAAALVLDAHPDYSPRDVKAVLVNTAETNIQTNPATQPGVLAPITRIGGGEVRADKAISTTSAAWAGDDDNPALSFGYSALTADKSFKKRVVVRNYSNTRRTYQITPSFRYADDAASGAVTPVAPAEITVPANGTRSFVIELKVDADKLPAWPFGGGNTGVGALLQSVEFDGYVELTSGGEKIHLPWHILPHRSAAVAAAASSVKLSASDQLKLNNTSAVQDGDVDVFTLTGTSKRISKDVLPGSGYNYAIVDLKAIGVRAFGGPSPVVQFGIATNGLRAHPNYPAEFDVYIDVDRDPNDTDKFEYVVYNSELTGFGLTGECVVNVVNLDTGRGAAYFFCDADLQSGNMIFTAPLAALGLTTESQFSFEVYAFDNYFSGNLTDAIWYMTTKLDEPRYYADQDFPVVPASGSETLTIGQSAGVWTEPTQTNGILLLYRNAQPGKESEVIRVR